MNESSPDNEYYPDGQSPPEKRRTRAKTSRKPWNQAEEKLLVDMKSAGANWAAIIEELWLQCGTVRGVEGCRTHFSQLSYQNTMPRDNNDKHQSHHQGQLPHPPANQNKEEQPVSMAGDGFQEKDHAYQLVDELLHHGSMLQGVKDAAPRSWPILGAGSTVNHTLLEKAAGEVAAALPDTPKFYLIVTAVAAAANHVQTPEYAAELMAQAGKALKGGENRSVFLAAEYERLSGHSISAQFLEAAMKAVELARLGQSKSCVNFCMWILQDNLPPAEVEAEKIMDRNARRAKRRAEITAGKFMWLCVAGKYDELLEQHHEV